jgi:hypothetical protein
MPSYLHEDDPLPERTTPQGTQANGVEHGHEERDVDFRALVKWFGALGIMMAIIMPVVWFGYQAARPLIEGVDAPPSPVFTQRWSLPMPRVLPNPFDAPVDRVVSLPQPLMGPAGYLVEARRMEEATLDRLELRYPATFDDPSKAGQPRLPERAVNAVIAAAGRAATGARGGEMSGDLRMMPSGYSGGTRMESRLR